MKGVILAGGTGTRLYPLTKLINKHLLPVGKVPMIFHAIEKMRQAEVRDIVIVTGKQSAGLFADYLGSGQEWGLNLALRIQEKAGGIAEALLLAEPFIDSGEKLIVLLGDNLFEDSLVPFAEKFKQQKSGAKVLLKRVKDPRHYGVPVLESERIVRIEEKPEKPASSYCVTGIYMYAADVFEVIRKIRPSARGEMEITDVNNVYAANGALTHDILEGWWTDAGTFESLYEAGERLKEEAQ